MKAKRVVPPMLAAAAAAAAVIPIVALGGPGSPEAPDLRADPPENPYLEFYDDSAQHNLGIGDRLLIRFDGFVTNVGQGPLEVSGNPQLPQSNDNGVKQRARDSITGVVDHIVGAPEVKYETADGHNHFHLMRVSRYSLWNTARTAEVAPGQKVGFCLYDIENAPAPSPTPDPYFYDYSVTQFCDQNNPATTDLRMGVGVGWRDVYVGSLSYQWVDVSNVSPGVYSLASEADPENVVWEGGGAAENNPRAFTGSNVTVPGYVAQPVSATLSGPTPITLSAQGYGGASGLRYRITSAPQHGTLSQPVGVGFTSPNLTYTPNPGSTKSDSFSYVAYQVGSPYPTSPPAATATINGQDVSVGISGAPASLTATTSAQLTANVTNSTAGVTWSVDGVVGGNPTVGSITSGGLYVAPDTPPPAGSVTIRATSVQDPSAFAEVVISIDPVPPPIPAPSPNPGTTGGPTAGPERAITKPIVYRRGRNFYAMIEANEAGKVTITGKHGTTRVGRCTRTLVEDQRFTCKMRLTKKQAKTPNKLKAIAVMRTADGDRERRATNLSTASSNSIRSSSATLKGRKLTVRAKIRQEGVVRAEIFVKGRRVATCNRFRKAGSNFACVRLLPPGTKRSQVRVKITQTKKSSSAVLGKRVTSIRR